MEKLRKRSTSFHDHDVMRTTGLDVLVLGLGLMCSAALVAPAPLHAAEANQTKVAPIGYPAGFEERKKEAEARREAKEAERRGVSDPGAQEREKAPELPDSPSEEGEGNR